MLEMKGFEVQHNYKLIANQINDVRLRLWKLNRRPCSSLDEKKQLLQIKLKELNRLPYGLDRIFRFPLFSATSCQRLIDITDSLVRDQGWTTDRHANFPTTDIAVENSPELIQCLEPDIRSCLYPMVAQYYDLNLEDLFLLDLFVVNYEMSGQRELSLHEDTSLLSFNCLLSDVSDFEGGGLCVPAINRLIHLNQGEAIVHSGQWLHAAQPITSGRRVVLVGFLGHCGIDHEALADIDE